MSDSIFLQTGNAHGWLWLILVIWLIVALISAVLGLIFLPAIYRRDQPVRGTFSYLFLISLGLPLGGVIIAAFAIFLSRRFPLPLPQPDIHAVTLPDFASELMANVKHGGGARLRIQLDNPRASVDERLNALVAIQSLDQRRSSPILRDLLSDSVEDVRLLVYGMLDNAEKQIAQQIHIELPRLANAESEAERYSINNRLAHLYWELIYQNLVLDDIYEYTLAQSDMYASAALAINEHNAPLWYLRGRLALIRREADLAKMYLRRAQEHGFPNDRLLPQLAEAEFQGGAFTEVRSLLSGVRHGSNLPSLQPVIGYWKS